MNLEKTNSYIDEDSLEQDWTRAYWFKKMKNQMREPICTGDLKNLYGLGEAMQLLNIKGLELFIDVILEYVKTNSLDIDEIGEVEFGINNWRRIHNPNLLKEKTQNKLIALEKEITSPSLTECPTPPTA